MISEAYVTVICDRCELEKEEIQLTTTARGYDERNLKSDLERLGWLIIGDEHYCPDCRDNEELKAALNREIKQPPADQGLEGAIP